MKIFSKYLTVNTSTYFLISNMHCYELHLDKFKGDFSQYLDFFAHSDSRF